MGRRIEAGPLVVALGAVLLLVSLFLNWFEPELSAWTAFEALDLLLAALALGALFVALGLIAPEIARVDRRWLAPLGLAALVVVASQIINVPPGAGNGDADSGAWLGLGGSLLMAAGALLTFARVRLALTVEGRDPRQRVSAVDARRPSGPADPDATEPLGATQPGQAPPAASPSPPPSGPGGAPPAAPPLPGVGGQRPPAPAPPRDG